jgi:hypothetical protein
VRTVASLILALLIALPAQSATRLYFGASATVGSVGNDKDNFITPAADAGWEINGELKRSELHPTPLRGRHFGYGEGCTMTQNSTNQCINMQWQKLLPAGVVFQNGVTTVKMQAMVRESTSTDDVNKCIIGIRIIDDDGTTVNATLLAVANYGSTLEMIAGTGSRNHICADGDTVTADYTSVDGDFLVVEQGFENDGATRTSPRGSSFTNDGSGYQSQGSTQDILTTGDCPVDNTTTVGGSQQGCTSWIEFSNTIAVQSDAGPATRFYLPSTGGTTVSPAVGGGWSGSSQKTYFRMSPTKGSTAMAAGTTINGNQSDYFSTLDRIYVSDPMAAGIVFTKGQTTVKGQVMMKYFATTDDLRAAALYMKIVDYAGTTLRAHILTPALPVGQTEFSTSFKNLGLARGTAIKNTYTTVVGDRVVAEIGAWMDDDGSASTTPQHAGNYGEDAADCPVDFTTTTTCAGWIELSNTLAFTFPRPSWFGKFLMVEPMGVIRSFLRSVIGSSQATTAYDQPVVSHN